MSAAQDGDELENLDPAVRQLLSEWLGEASGLEDTLMDLYSFLKQKLLERDGFWPSSAASRRGSVDPVKDGVIRGIAEGLRKEKNEFVASFIKEWIDSSDDPNGIIFETPIQTSISPLIQDQEALGKLLSWDNDYLSYTPTELVNRSVQIYSQWGFFEKSSLDVDRDKFVSFVRIVAKHYRSENPYHNFHHAHSVLAVSGNLIRSCCPGMWTELEEFSILTAAMCHDVGHRALNSDYYIKTRHQLAIQYNDISVLENMHCSLTFDLLRTTDFTIFWTDDQWTTFRKTFIQSVLATDMKSHFELTSKINPELTGQQLNPEQKKVLYQSLVHAADLSNPVMPTKACYDWAFRVVEEMYEQGKLEERAGFVIAPFMRHSPTEEIELAKLQVSFVGFIVAPLWRSLALLWPVLEARVGQLEKNLEFWESLRDQAIGRTASQGSEITRSDSKERIHPIHVLHTFSH
jgi:hypothetical protein